MTPRDALTYYRRRFECDALETVAIAILRQLAETDSWDTVLNMSALKRSLGTGWRKLLRHRHNRKLCAAVGADPRTHLIGPDRCVTFRFKEAYKDG